MAMKKGKAMRTLNREVMLLGSMILLFSVVAIAGFGLELSDQNIYIYMGRLIAEGNVPYKDFFFSHPPGEIYLDAAIYSVFGFGLTAFKIASLIAILGSAVLIYIIVKQHFSGEAGVLAAAIFLMTYEILRIAAGNIGMAFTILLGLLGLYFFFRDKYLVSGIFLGLSAMFTFHALPAAAGIAICSLFRIRQSKLIIRVRDFSWLLLGILISFGLPNLVVLMVAGQQYWQQVVQYHLAKPSAAVPGLKWGLFKLMLKYNPIILLSPFVLLFALGKKDDGHEHLFPLLAVVAANIIYLIALSRIFPYYFAGLFVFLAMLGGIGIMRLASRIRMKGMASLGMGILLLTTLGLASRQYYWTMDNTFQNNELDRMSKNFASDCPLFGDYLFVPIIGLTKGNTIALNEVDTNPLRFQAGAVDIKGMAEKLAWEGNVCIILRQSNNFMLYYNETASYLDNGNCTVLDHFELRYPSYFERQLVADRVFSLQCLGDISG